MVLWIIGKVFNMKLAIMQPYFFPYLGYFSLIKGTDKWIVFDQVQFIRHGWIERNRILKPDAGWQYISVPLEKHSRETLIKDIKIRKNEEWESRLFRQIEHYKKIAPYYHEVVEFLNKAFESKYDDISRLNVHLLAETCKYLSIKFNYDFFSEMSLTIEQINGPGDWALNISKALKAKEYFNLPGGMEIFDKKAFENADIKLKFLTINLTNYFQRERFFEPSLSILDVMMFNSKETISEMLNQYELT
jgi:hypothetical protein